MEFTGFESNGFDEDAVQTKVDFDSTTPINATPTIRADEKMVSVEQKKSTDLSTIIGTMGIKMASANTELTGEHINSAKLNFAAKLSPVEAENYLAHHDINKSIVDRSRYGIMLKDNETGKYTLALRGMRPTDPRDVLNASLQTTRANESLSMANNMIDKVLAQGGEIEHITGFSLGGADALTISMERGMDATIFDPPINPSHIWTNSTATRPNSGNIEIIRNPENFISIGSSLRNVSLSPQYKVSVVPVGKSGIFANHELLPNFIQTQLDSAEMTARNMVNVANKFAQHETLFDMKDAMNNNKSFTEFYRELNSRGGEPSGIDVDVGGVFNKLGDRVNENATIVKLWRKVGGNFNPDELAHLNRATRSPYTQDVVAEDDILNHIKNNELDVARNKAVERFTNAMNSVNSDEVLSHPAVKSSVNNHILNAVHPVNMATGIIGALAGEKAMSYIDPSGSFGQYNETGILEHTAVSGSITGAFSDILMNGLSGGSGLFSDSVLGLSASAGVGAVAGEATRYGVDRGLDELGANTDTKESLSNLSGGLVGGATASLSGDALAIATASLTGAEVGELAGPAGVLVGAGIGAIFGVSAYGIAKLNQVPAVRKAENRISRDVLKGWRKIKSWF